MQLMKAIDDASKNVVSEYVGTTVYFMSESHIIKGVVTGHDRIQMFVNHKYAIKYSDDFFTSEADLVDHLIKTKRDLTVDA